jgi:hypothetical protein
MKINKVTLQFAPAGDRLPRGAKLRDGISGVASIGDTLWVVSDETRAIERLRRTRAGAYAAHASFPLDDYLRLPGKKRLEADVEDLDIADGYLWMVGSHAADREMPEGDHPAPSTIAKTLAKVERHGVRCLIARIPMVASGGLWALERRDESGDVRRVAARLDGDAEENALVRALRGDRHLDPYLDLPGKENGLDIEGIAVAGKRVLLGLRGPVLHEWSVILEIEPRETRDVSRLRLGRFGAEAKRYRKHFLKLGGLGIRGLCRHGPDVLVLAGPLNSPDGPSRLYRWRGGARTDRERQLRPADLHPVMDLPTGPQGAMRGAGAGADHPEGIAVITRAARDHLLVVYEMASKRRYIGAHGVAADVSPIPA